MAAPSFALRPVLKPRFRVVCGTDIALGPGKMELLAALVETQSLTQAARRLDMSYMRAWTLINAMNRFFSEPVATAERGGKGGGGMIVTDTGRRALALYHEIETTALKASSAPWRRLQRMIKPGRQSPRNSVPPAPQRVAKRVK